MLSLPGFSFSMLYFNFEFLEDTDFRIKYGTLYQNLNPRKHTVYKMTTIFCLKRIIFSIVTAYLGSYIVPSIYCYTFIPLFSIGYNINNKPLNTKAFNFMENVNELFILINAYFLAMFNEWICDPNTRYALGWIYIPIEVVVISINLFLIFYELALALRKIYREWSFKRKMKKFLEDIKQK